MSVVHCMCRNVCHVRHAFNVLCVCDGCWSYRGVAIAVVVAQAIRGQVYFPRIHTKREALVAAEHAYGVPLKVVGNHVARDFPKQHEIVVAAAHQELTVLEKREVTDLPCGGR